MSGHVEVQNAALDDWENNSMVLRGTIAPSSLTSLLVDDYQRDILSAHKIDELVDAHRKGRVPDIELGMRGEHFEERASGLVILFNPIYIVDGLQRVTAGKKLMQLDPDARPHIGATIHFNTTEPWERERFKVLNLKRTKLSPNVTLRNMRHDYSVADELYRMSTGSRSQFVMRGLVCWEQNMRNTELITASVFFKSVGMLHSHIGPGRSSNAVELTEGLQKIMATAGRNAMLSNIRLFYGLIDELWGVKTVAYRSGAIHLKQSFLLALARVFNDNLDFWDGPLLQIDTALKRRLSQFPITDPTVTNLASGSTSAISMLVQLMTDHLNYKKTTKRLRPRNYIEPVTAEASDSNDDDELGDD